MIKTLDRTERPSPIQILKDATGQAYETEEAKANALHRIYALNCKQDSSGKQHRETKKRMRQRKKVLTYVDSPTPAPPVSRYELKAALRQLHLNKAAGSDRVSNEMILNLSKKNLDRVHNLINVSVTTGQVPTA